MLKFHLLLFFAVLTLSAGITDSSEWPRSGYPEDFRTRCRWIWYPENFLHSFRQNRYFRKDFILSEKPVKAILFGKADDQLTLFVNGREVKPVSRSEKEYSRDYAWMNTSVFDIQAFLIKGKNTVAAKVYNGSSCAGLRLRGDFVLPDGTHSELVTDRSWKASKSTAENWTLNSFNDARWLTPRELGDVRAAPWGGTSYREFLTADEIPEYDRRVARRHSRNLAMNEKLASEIKTTPRIFYRKGQPFIHVGNRDYIPFLYKSSKLSIDDPKTIRKLEAFRNAGSHLYTIDFNLSTAWKGKGRIVLPDLENQMLRILELDPEAHFFVGIVLDSPQWMLKKYPDEWIGYEQTVPKLGGDLFRDIARFSFASEVFRKETGAILRNAVRQLEELPAGKRIVAYMPHYGIYTEWHYYGMQYGVPDTGKAMHKAFRAYLRGKYQNDASRLRQAWQNPSIDFDTVRIPGKTERDRRASGVFRTWQANAQVLDYLDCHAQVVADCLRFFNRTVKEAADGKVLAGNYAGYFFGMDYPAEGWHIASEKMLDSPEVDFQISPYPYSTENRSFGGTGMSRALTETYRLRGNKLLIYEDDTRTHLNETNRIIYASTLEDSVALLNRGLVYTMISGSGVWYLDFGMNWYDHPEIYQTFQKAGRIRAADADQTSVAEIALIADFESVPYLQNPVGPSRLSYTAINASTQALMHSGAPFDALTFSDLSRPGLRDYKVYFFPNLFYLTPVKKAIVEKLKRDGKTLIFLYAPGFITPSGPSLDSMQDLTGLSFGISHRERQLILSYTGMSPVSGLAGKKMPSRSSYQPGGNPVFFIDDSSAITLGTFTVEGKQRAGLVWKNCGKYRVIYSAAPAIDTDFWRSVLPEIGVHLYSNDARDVLYVNRSFLAVHTADGGMRTFTLPKKAGKVIQLLPERKNIKDNTENFSVSLPPRSTALFQIID